MHMPEPPNFGDIFQILHAPHDLVRMAISFLISNLLGNSLSLALDHYLPSRIFWVLHAPKPIHQHEVLQAQVNAYLQQKGQVNN